MADTVKFMSDEWCKVMIDAENSNPKVYGGYKDPKKFTHKLEFSCLDRDLATHQEWVEGVITAWCPAASSGYSEDDIYMRVQAKIEDWRQVAEDKIEGGKALMMGKVKIVKGPMSEAIENAGTFNNFLRTWGSIPTDWDV